MGPCCEEQLIPGCPTNVNCDNCVCALDTFCCETSWDGLCAETAMAVCPIECNCGENPVVTDCGNSVCEFGETCATCPVDCGDCVICGNEICEASETCTTCPQDCGTCGNGNSPQTCCEPSSQDLPGCNDQTCVDCICGADAFCCDTLFDASCAAQSTGGCSGSCDCGGPVNPCGDGICTPGAESCLTCEADCGPCATCGDGVCTGTESCATCAVDCGPCPSGNDCCTPSTDGTTGCNEGNCQECVCLNDSFCCNTGWDSLCASSAATGLCAGACSCSGGGGVGPVGECVGFCDTSAPSGCYCDSACMSFGDCCPDVCASCGYCDPGGPILP